MSKGIITTQEQKIKYSGIALLSILLFGKLIFLFLTFNHGVDISDEGMHLLMYKYPQEYSVTIHNYHYLVTSLLPPSLVTVFNLRVFWLIADVLGWLILFTGCISFVRSQGVNIPKTTALLLLLFGGNALALSIHDRIIAYNAFSSLFMNVSAGLLLFAIGRQSFAVLSGLLI